MDKTEISSLFQREGQKTSGPVNAKNNQISGKELPAGRAS
jgi:hypothetical protein